MGLCIPQSLTEFTLQPVQSYNARIITTRAMDLQHSNKVHVAALCVLQLDLNETMSLRKVTKGGLRSPTYQIATYVISLFLRS